MSWFSKFLNSSIGKKLIMSLTGLFLILFLVIHLVGNLQLLAGDGGKSFNEYAHFMVSNPLIKTVSIGLYAFIILHAIQGLMLRFQNGRARKDRYKVKKNPNTTWASRQMALLGTLLLAFLLLHMGDFWFQAKFGELGIDKWGHEDLYGKVAASFQNTWIVIAYLLSMVVLTFHLWHGFSSAFQTLGINHRKWTPVIKVIGYAYAIIIPIGFAIIPIIFYLQNK